MEQHPADQPRQPLLGIPFAALQSQLVALGLEAFRARQLWHWVYVKGGRDFASLTTISKPAREILATHFVVDRPRITTHQQSVDGTQKWLFGLSDGQQVEAVFIPDVTAGRGALCISSQVGCTLTCRFCHTGTQRLVRNLTPGEIIGQVMAVRDVLGEWATPYQHRKLNNIVLMGMGEPLFNYDNVAAALKCIMDPDGIAISKRRITLSTSGVVPLIARCGAELGVNLAVSLHATQDALRDAIIPLNRKYPIAELIAACRAYPALSNSRRITFEYVMLKGVNDSDADAKALVKLLHGIPAKINLIPFNPWPGAPFTCSDDATIQRFGDIVNAAGYASPVRTPRGRDIMAACGQLKSASTRMRVAQMEAITALQREKEQAQGLLG